jgi:hypothetical protein
MNSCLEIVFEVDPRDPFTRIGRRQSDRQGLAGSEREKAILNAKNNYGPFRFLDFVL